jgi:hypothetical protein
MQYPYPTKARPRWVISAAFLLSAGFALLLVAWAFADPPGASPDEPAHYIKAVAAGHGDLRGVADPSAAVPGATPAQAAWLRTVTRDFTIPGPLVPAQFACEGLHPDVTARCHLAPAPQAQQPTRLPSYVGDYPPTLYVGAGVLMRAAGDAVTALLVGRLASAAVVLVLLGLAAALLASRRRPHALAALAVAVTPMVVFLGSSLNPNGGEIAAAICFTAGCLRLSRAEPSPPWVWLVTGVVAALLAASRTLGPVWVGMILLVALVLLGPRAAFARIRAGGGWAAIAALATAAGLAAALGWDVLTHGHTAAATTSIGSRLTADLKLLPGVVLPEQIGVFGFLDVELPRAVYWAWEAAAGLLLVVALAVASVRERVALVLAAVLAVAVTLAVAVLLIDPTGFPTQGRYTLPFSVVVLLLAGELLRRHPDRLRRVAPIVLGVGVGAAALLQCYGWWQNARRYAVGADGPFWFIPDAQWAPPGGWWPWIAVMLAGVAAMASAAVLVARASADEEEGGRDFPDHPLVFPAG